MNDLADLIALPGEVPCRVPELAGGDDIDAVFRNRSTVDRVAAWRKVLARQNSDLWRLFAFHPGTVGRSFTLDEQAQVRWQMLAEIYETWYGMAADNAVPGLGAREAALGAGYLARTRWLLLSAPFRRRIDGEPVDSLIERTREAREAWLGVLAAIQDYPSLAAIIDVEADARDVAMVEIGRDALEQGSGGDPARTGIGGYVVTRILLPRFAWYDTARAIRRMQGDSVLWGWYGAAALFALALAAFLTGPAWPWAFTASAALAIAGYAVIACSAVAVPASGWVWLLRQPASSAVGLLTLAALPADWWSRSDPGTALAAVVVLTAIGLGYLAIEAGNHGTRGWALVRRVATVGTIGFGHAAAASVIGLRFVLPAFAATAEAPGVPESIACWWSTHGCGPALDPWLLVLAATSWSFVSGVFLQILWDNQPITAPLAHVAWRKGPR